MCYALTPDQRKTGNLEADRMSGVAAVWALLHSIYFNLNFPVLNVNGRSGRDLLIISLYIILAMFTCFILIVTVLLITDEGGMTGYGNCGSPQCIEQ